MTWILLALLAPTLWAITNLIDTRLIRRHAQSPAALSLITGALAVIPFLCLLATGSATDVSWSTGLVAAVAGALAIAGYYPYYRAIETTHPTSVMLLWNLAPIMVAALAFFVLGERLPWPDYAAVVLLVASAAVAGVSAASHAKTTNRAVAWMAFASLIVAVEAILLKWVFADAGTEAGLTVFFGAQVATAVLAFTITDRFRKDLLAIARARATGLVVTNELINLAAVTSASVAIGLGPVSVVKAIGGLQPILVIFFATAVSRIFGRRVIGLPRKPGLVPTIAATALAAVGLGFLSIG